MVNHAIQGLSDPSLMPGAWQLLYQKMIHEKNEGDVESAIIDRGIRPSQRPVGFLPQRS